MIKVTKETELESPVCIMLLSSPFLTAITWNSFCDKSNMHLVFVFGIWVFIFFIWHLYSGLKLTQFNGIWANNWFVIWNRRPHYFFASRANVFSFLKDVLATLCCRNVRGHIVAETSVTETSRIQINPVIPLSFDCWHFATFLRSEPVFQGCPKSLDSSNWVQGNLEPWYLIPIVHPFPKRDPICMLNSSFDLICLCEI